MHAGIMRPVRGSSFFIADEAFGAEAVVYRARLPPRGCAGDLLLSLRADSAPHHASRIRRIVTERRRL